MNETRETIESRLIDAHGKVREAFVGIESATLRHNEASVVLAQSKAAIYLAHSADPKALGGNEAARAAKVDEMTDGMARTARESEDALRLAKLAMSLAQLDWTLAKELNALLGTNG